MPRKTKTAANTGKSARPQLSKQMFEELIPGLVTKEQFADIFDHVREHLNNPPKQQTSSKPTLQTRSDARTHRISAKKPLLMRLLAHFSAI